VAFYANYLGLNSREVNTLNHTTVEYLNRATTQWVDDEGTPLSQYKVRKSTLFEALKTQRLITSSSDFDAANYEGYAPSQYAALMWRMGTNFLEVDRWDSRLRSLGLPKSLRQLVLLTAGVQPRFIILTVNSLAAYLRALQLFILGGLVLVMALNLGVCVAGLARVTKARSR
jgi:hypothetical protein